MTLTDPTSGLGFSFGQKLSSTLHMTPVVLQLPKAVDGVGGGTYPGDLTWSGKHTFTGSTLNLSGVGATTLGGAIGLGGTVTAACSLGGTIASSVALTGTVDCSGLTSWLLGGSLLGTAAANCTITGAIAGTGITSLSIGASGSTLTLAGDVDGSDIETATLGGKAELIGNGAGVLWRTGTISDANAAITTYYDGVRLSGTLTADRTYTLWDSTITPNDGERVRVFATSSQTYDCIFKRETSGAEIARINNGLGWVAFEYHSSGNGWYAVEWGGSTTITAHS